MDFLICWRPILFGVLLAWLAPGVAYAAERSLPTSQGEIHLSFAPLVKKAAPAVVNIYARKMVRQRGPRSLFNDPFFRRFFGSDHGFGEPRERIERSLGSGVIVAGDGLIITNNHVIEAADEITVVLADRREFAATIVGADKRTDLAVLRVKTAGEALPFLEFRDSDDLEVGDLVLAIGNPFGVGQTVTSGIVSGLARTQIGISDLNFFIQTDAAINPGNSGGALITMDGKLVGVNTAIFSQSGGSQGIGFAIPANMVRSVIVGVTNGGHVVRPWLGVKAQRVTSKLAAAIGLRRPAGAIISDIYPGAAAVLADMRVGDVVIAIDGRDVDDLAAMNFRVATLSLGSIAKFSVIRDGEKKVLSLRMVKPPEIPARKITELGGVNPFSGAVVANLSPAVADELRMDPFETGVVIVKLRSRSTAQRLRFHLLDTIFSINGVEVETVDKLERILSGQVKRWDIIVKRKGKKRRLVIE